MNKSGTKLKAQPSAPGHLLVLKNQVMVDFRGSVQGALLCFRRQELNRVWKKRAGRQTEVLAGAWMFKSVLSGFHAKGRNVKETAETILRLIPDGPRMLG